MTKVSYQSKEVQCPDNEEATESCTITKKIDKP